MSGNAATLVVHRPGGYYVDVARRYWIELDGQRIGTVANGGVERFEVPAPGPHRVRATIDWTGSPELEFVAEPGAEVHLVVLPTANPVTALLRMWGSTSYLRLERRAVSPA